MRLSQGGGIWATIPHLLLLLLLLFIPNYFITISNLGSAFHTEYSHPPSNPPIQPCSPSSSYFAPSLPPPSPHPSPYLITPPASDILIPPPPSLPPLITPSAFDILMFVFLFLAPVKRRLSSSLSTPTWPWPHGASNAVTTAAAPFFLFLLFRLCFYCVSLCCLRNVETGGCRSRC